MKVGEWAGALFYRVGLGCRCWTNLCGTVPRSSSGRSRGLERDYSRGLDSIVESSANGDDESIEPGRYLGLRVLVSVCICVCYGACFVFSPHAPEEREGREGKGREEKGKERKGRGVLWD